MLTNKIVHKVYSASIVFFFTFLLTGCANMLAAITPEAQLEIAKREVSIRAVGMMGIEPQTGTIFCILCWVSYDRNTGQGPMPPEAPAK